MATADCKGGRKPTEGTLNHFEKLLEGPCLNHAFPIKHLYRDYDLMKWFGVHSAGFQPRLRSTTSEPSCRCLFFFLLGRLGAPSPASSSHFALPLRRSKIAPTASSLEAWLVVMSRSSLVVRGPLRPSL